MSIIEFAPKKPELHTLQKKREEYKYPRCDHRAMWIDAKKGMVECKACHEEMSCLEALLKLSSEIWFEENRRERQLEYDEKRVTKVQSAAIACLYEAGITPEKYAVRWAKLKEEEAQKAVPIAPEPKPIESASAPSGAA